VLQIHSQYFHTQRDKDLSTYMQGRLIQWARWVRAQGPQASGAPKQPMRYFFHLVK